MLTILKSVLTKPRENFTSRSKFRVLWVKRSAGVPVVAADRGYGETACRKIVRDWQQYERTLGCRSLTVTGQLQDLPSYRPANSPLQVCMASSAISTRGSLMTVVIRDCCGAYGVGLNIACTQLCRTTAFVSSPAASTQPMPTNNVSHTLKRNGRGWIDGKLDRHVPPAWPHCELEDIWIA